MRGVKAVTRIALGQASCVASVLLLVFFLGWVPDRDGAVLDGRARLAEALAANSSTFLTQRDLRRLESDLKLVVERDETLLSAAVRRDGDRLVLEVGDHVDQWVSMQDGRSSNAQLLVPIWAGDHRWGQLELRFEPLGGGLGWADVFSHPWIQLTGFVVVVCFVLFRLYLAKMLKHLDPSQAIPTRVRTALDTMAEGLLVLDRQQNIVLANLAFAETLGRPADDLLGLHPSSFGWTDRQGRALDDDACPWSTMFETGEARRNEIIHLDRPGEGRRTFSVNASPILVGGARPLGALVSFDDVTELEQKERALEAAKEEAESANRTKSEFLANMSHEIRTPMNAILGFADVLRKRPIASGQEEARYLGIIQSSGQHLLELINDLLDLSKVESGRLEVEQIECAPHVLLAQTIQAIAVKAEEKGIGLDLEVEGRVPERIVSDPARLRQIVTNLVGNAIRFTEAGGVRVIERLVSREGRSWLEVDVADSGVGIPEDKLEAIFEAFSQADASITRRFGGTGLGLAISRNLARKLGGDISVASRVGEGSTFTVRLPTGPLEGVALLDAEAALAARAELVGDDRVWVFERGHVLVVDDYVENRELARILLEEAGLSVEEAENGADAVEKVRAGGFDAVLMDVQMPVMDGYTAARTLRAEGVGLPMYALTAHAMKGIEETCREAGFDGHLAKPIDEHALFSTLARVLGNGERVERATLVSEPAPDDAPAPRESAETSRPAPAADPDAPAEDGPLVSRHAGNPRMRKVIRRFPARLAEQLEGVEKALAEQDFEIVASLAHALKGVGGTLGFDAFHPPSKRLEEAAKAADQAGVERELAILRDLERRIVVPGEDD